MHDHDAVSNAGNAHGMQSGPSPVSVQGEQTTPGVGAIPSNDPVYALHIGLAEQGKLYALRKDYRLALYYYRKAMQMTVEHKHPEIFFRHYLECLIEALEQQRWFDDVVNYCNRALDLYAKNPPQDALGQRDVAHIYQRLGVIRLKQGNVDAARTALRKGIEIIKGAGQTMALAQTLLRWLDQGIHVDERRVNAEQERNKYYSVRKDTICEARALRLPDEIVKQECPL